MDKEEKIEFKHTIIVFEAYSKQTLETTLHYGRFYLRDSGSDVKKYFYGSSTPGMDVFPADVLLLKDIPYTMIDSTSYPFVDRSRETTLYLDPRVFTREDYVTLVEFLKQPVFYNKFVRWLDTFVLGLVKDKPYYSVHAVVYKNIRDLEPQYHAIEGKDWVKVRVNNKLWVNTTLNDLETTSLEEYSLRNDTLFYPSYVALTEIERLLNFQSANGIQFRTRVKALQPIQ